MAQGYTGYTVVGRQVSIEDGPNLDAFSRLRVSDPLSIFNNQFTYDLSPLIFEQFSDNPGVAFANHNSIDRTATIQFTIPIPGNFIYMQSYEYIPYQPGKSQLVFITFNFFPGGGISGNSVRTAGLGDNDNGFFFTFNDAGSNLLSFILKSNTNAGISIVNQSSWNLDKLDGTGRSGITLDITKTQILVIDFQALYAGRVRMGFDIGGQIIYAHEFLHANTFNYPYIATANLPIRVGMESLTGSPDLMEFICCSVSSEGGIEDDNKFAYTFVQYGSATITASDTQLVALRPAATFNSIVNRTKFILQEVDIFNIGNRSIQWKLSVDPVFAVPPTYNLVNASFSAMEYDLTGSCSTGSIIIDSGYAAPGGANKGALSSSAIAARYPITLDAAGNPRNYGTLALTANVIGALASIDVYYVIKWKEIR